MNQAPTLRTERLILRKPKESDIQDRLVYGEHKEIVRMFGGDTRNMQPFTHADAERWYEAMMKNP